MSRNWFNVGKLKYAEGSVVCKEIFKGPINAALYCMAKGTEIPPQASAKSGMIFVLEGLGVCELEGESLPMHPGVMIRLEKKAVHAIRADGNLAFILQLC
ncbi:MAG: cupin domain-containing protein [Candidatus Aenigmatarchaeota archaeon]